MRTSECVRLLMVLAVPILFALTRCAPHEPCVRISDCDDGMTCKAGRCVEETAPPPGPAPADASQEASAGSASDAASSSSKDATTDATNDATVDASASDAADASDATEASTD